LGPWSSSSLALSGRPSVLRSTSTLPTLGSKGYVRRDPPWISTEVSWAPGDGVTTFSELTLVEMGHSIMPMLRTMTVLGPWGVPITVLKWRSLPFSPYTRMLTGSLSSPCQSSTTASSGPSAVLRTTCTCSTAWDWNDQVRRDWPCTVNHDLSIDLTCINGRASLFDFGSRWRLLGPLPVWREPVVYCVPRARNGLNTSRASAETSKVLVDVLLCCASWSESSMWNLRRAVPGKTNVKRARPRKFIMEIRGKHATRTLPNESGFQAKTINT